MGNNGNNGLRSVGFVAYITLAGLATYGAMALLGRNPHLREKYGPAEIRAAKLNDDDLEDLIVKLGDGTLLEYMAEKTDAGIVYRRRE